MKQATTILIVDDDQVYCQLLKKGLSRIGYEVSVAHCGSEALAEVKHSKPNIVLLDMRLGEESGLGVIEPLLVLHPEAKIIMVTAFASLATAVSAVKMGVLNYLAKPVDVKSIHAMVQDSMSTESATPLDPKLPDQSPSLKQLEWEHINRVLEENEGNVSRTARALGMHRRTLQRKLKKHAPSLLLD